MPQPTAPDLAPPRLGLGARIARVPSVLVASRTRLVALWGAVGIGLGGVAIAVGMFAMAEAPPAPGIRITLDLIGVLSVGLAYLLLTGRRRQRLGTQTAPIRMLWTLLGISVALLGLEALFAVVVEGAVDPKTRLPLNLETAVVAGIAAVAEGLFAAGLLAGLRSLVLYRRKPLAVWLWGGFLFCTLGFGLSMAGSASADEGNMYVSAFFVAFGSLFALACAFRQGWVGVLSLRQRAMAAAAAAALGGTLLGLFFFRDEGPARLVIAGAVLDGGSMTYAAAISYAAEQTTRLVLIAGILYSLTATLVLLFQLPTSEALAQRAGERRAMRSLADLAGQGLDVASISQAVARAPVEAGLADAAWVVLPDTETGSLVPRIEAAHPIATETASGAADYRALAEATRTAPLVVEHAAADHRIRARPGDGIGSLVALRLASGPEGGTLVVARRSPEAFQPDDVAALETFSAQAGLALANSRLFADALEREKLARELALAREVQQRLLPETLPEIPGVRLAAIEKPAQTVGGDYYDAIALADDCLGVVVADVSGKGAGAAFYMAEMKGIFQAASRLTRSPSEFLFGANEALASSLRRGAFITTIYGVLDAEAGTLALARAGHCPALLIRHDPASGERTTRYIRPDGLALGLDKGPLFRKTLVEDKLHLEANDVVLLFTDGLVEARTASGDAYGYDRLAESAARLCTQNDTCDPLSLRDALLADVAAFTGSPETDDDVTLVVVAWDGPS